MIQSALIIVDDTLTSTEHNRNLAMFSACRPHRDFNILAERDEKVHQPFNGKVSRAVAHQRRDMGLLDSEHPSRLRQRKTALFDDTVDLQCQMGFQLFAFGIGKSQVRKYVAAVFFE